MASDGHGSRHLLVVDDEVGVALVVVKDHVDLRIHPVVHARVKQVTGGVAGVDGGRPAHGGVSSGEPEGQTEEVREFSSQHPPAGAASLLINVCM